MDKIVVSQDKTLITVYMINGPNLRFKFRSRTMLVERIRWVVSEINRVFNAKVS